MIDVARRPLEVGDIIAATRTGHPDLHIGAIVRFTPKKIVVTFKNKRGPYEETKFQTQVCFIRKSEV